MIIISAEISICLTYLLINQYKIILKFYKLKLKKKVKFILGGGSLFLLQVVQEFIFLLIQFIIICLNFISRDYLQLLIILVKQL